MKKQLVILALALALLSPCIVLPAAPALAASDSYVAQAVAQAVVAQAAPAQKAPAKVEADKRITITMFCIFIAITLYIVYWAAKRTTTSGAYYAASSQITGTQNGWAMAGDFMSAASFLGVSGLISLFGWDGMMYAIGTSFAYVTLLLLMAEPCRNVGKYTVGDILSFRASPVPVRATMAFAAVLLSVMYLVVQMVGGGKLMELLLGIPYSYAVIIVGILMLIYVVAGGMIATTWVQIIKAGLLMGGGVVLFVLMWAHFNFNPLRFFSEVVSSTQIQSWVQLFCLKQPVADPGFEYGRRFLEPALLQKNVWDQVSLGVGSFLLGVAGMPHILMRFFTVPDAKAARKSIVVAMILIGIFFVMVTLFGLGAAVIVSPQTIFAVDKGGNMANLLMSQLLGANIAPVVGDLLLAFLCAVAFATILAVVAGLVLAAAGAIAHDVWVMIIRRGKATQREQVMAARITSVVVGIVSIVIGISSENVNVAHLATLAFAIAASGVVPAVLFSLFWRKMTTAAICSTLLVGTVVSLALVLVSPNMTYPKLVADGAKAQITSIEKKQADGQVLAEKEKTDLAKARQVYEANKDGKSIMGLDRPWFPLRNPGIVSAPIGWLVAILVALAFPSKREDEKFDEIYVRQTTGMDIDKLIGA
ncbi:MAG: cation acetate symporter [Desulfomonilaceae bacterium]